MNVIIDIPTTDAADRCFLTWVPVNALVHIENAEGPPAMHRVTLRNGGTPGGGKVIFNTKRSDDGTPTLALNVPSDGSAVGFWVAGEFGEPSIDYGDAVIEAVDAAGTVIGTRKLMVRIRKNAVKLTGGERNRFLEALGKLNDAGKGPFQSFRDMHADDGYPEEHGFAGFLPWHRAYLLDLERSLQDLDASVTLPYWRFDEPAPALFAPEFFGMPDPDETKGDVVLFPHGHPLEFWRTDGADAIFRRPTFNINSAPPQFTSSGRERVISQHRTLTKGGPNQEFYLFRRMEGAPHGAAHTSFSEASPITDPSTAPKDPLFFLLHCNVDRLWAFWQWRHKRTREDQSTTYSLLGSLRFDETGNVGAGLDDSMWPWNGIKDPPRPAHAPRPSFPPSPFNFAANPNPSPFITGPGEHPIVRAMIDFQGIYTRKHIGFGYDDVPFELETEDLVA